MYNTSLLSSAVNVPEHFPHVSCGSRIDPGKNRVGGKVTNLIESKGETAITALLAAGYYFFHDLKTAWKFAFCRGMVRRIIFQ